MEGLCYIRKLTPLESIERLHHSLLRKISYWEYRGFPFREALHRAVLKHPELIKSHLFSLYFIRQPAHWRLYYSLNGLKKAGARLREELLTRTLVNSQEIRGQGESLLLVGPSSFDSKMRLIGKWPAEAITEDLIELNKLRILLGRLIRARTTTKRKKGHKCN